MSPWRRCFGPSSSFRAPAPTGFPRPSPPGADAVVFDLEDGVEASRKAEARRAVAAWLTCAAASGSAQIRARQQRPHRPGLRRIWRGCRRSSDRIDAVVLPKTESPQDVERVAAAAPARRVIPLLETARGIVSAAAIAGANAEIPALFFGAEDLTAELGIPRTLAGDEILLARSQVVLAAATIGAEAIDAVFVDSRRPTACARTPFAPARSASAARWRFIPIRSRSSTTSSRRRPTRSPRRSGCVEADAAARARGEGAYRARQPHGGRARDRARLDASSQSRDRLERASRPIGSPTR